MSQIVEAITADQFLDMVKGEDVIELPDRRFQVKGKSNREFKVTSISLGTQEIENWKLINKTGAIRTITYEYMAIVPAKQMPFIKKKATLDFISTLSTDPMVLVKTGTVNSLMAYFKNPVTSESPVKYDDELLYTDVTFLTPRLVFEYIFADYVAGVLAHSGHLMTNSLKTNGFVEDNKPVVYRINKTVFEFPAGDSLRRCCFENALGKQKELTNKMRIQYYNEQDELFSMFKKNTESILTSDYVDRNKDPELGEFIDILCGRGIDVEDFEKGMQIAFDRFIKTEY